MSREKMVLSWRFLGNVAPDDPLGQPLGNGGLPNAASPMSTGLFFVFRLENADHISISSRPG